MDDSTVNPSRLGTNMHQPTLTHHIITEERNQQNTWEVNQGNSNVNDCEDNQT